MIGMIDCHTHMVPRDWLDLAEKYGDDRWPVRRELDACSAELYVSGRHFRTVPHYSWDANARIEQMDATGVSVQWISATPVLFSYWAPPSHAAEFARHLNDSIAEMVRVRPDRFVGLASLPMTDPELSIAELDRAVHQLGLRGVEIGTNIAGRELDDPTLLPIFAAIAEHNVPVFVHPWDVGQSSRLSAYNAMYTIGMPTETSYAALALLQGNVLGRVPNLRVLLAHGAGALAWLLPRIDRGWQTWPERRAATTVMPSETARRLWADTLVGDELNLQLVGHRVGVDHLVVGSDYPFPFGVQQPGDLIDGSSLDDETRQAISRTNAARLLTGAAEDHSKEDA
jgi:aminocarboxymuconate-semialdehyde decarboxylase